jgi:hypothetical protein
LLFTDSEDVHQNLSYRLLASLTKISRRSFLTLTWSHLRSFLKCPIIASARISIFTFWPLPSTPHQTVDGRAWFAILNVFDTSIPLRGRNHNDGWLLLHVEFLFRVAQDRTGLLGTQPSLSYPLFTPHTELTSVLKDQLRIDVDNRLSCHLPIPEYKQPPDAILTPPKGAEAPQDVVEAPLV